MRPWISYFLLAIGVCVMIFIGVSNQRIAASLKEKSQLLSERSPMRPSVSSTDNPPAPQSKMTTTITKASEQYGIYEHAQTKDFWNDQQWEAYVKRTLDETHVLDAQESEKAFVGIKKTPQEFQKRLKDLNRRIQYYEDLKRKDLNNEDIQKKLENLYILKSTLLALENKIITPSKNASQEEPE